MERIVRAADYSRQWAAVIDRCPMVPGRGMSNHTITREMQGGTQGRDTPLSPPRSQESGFRRGAGGKCRDDRDPERRKEHCSWRGGWSLQREFPLLRHRQYPVPSTRYPVLKRRQGRRQIATSENGSAYTGAVCRLCGPTSDPETLTSNKDSGLGIGKKPEMPIEIASRALRRSGMTAASRAAAQRREWGLKMVYRHTRYGNSSVRHILRATARPDRCWWPCGSGHHPHARLQAALPPQP